MLIAKADLAPGLVLFQTQQGLRLKASPILGHGLTVLLLIVHLLLGYRRLQDRFCPSEVSPREPR